MIAYLAALALVAIAPAAPQYAGPWVLRAGRSFQHIGSFRIDRDPTYRGAIRAFGAASSCRLVPLEDGAIVTWRELGIRMRIATLAAIPAGRNACTAPAALKIDNVRVTGRRWRTALGLQVGSGDALVRRLYPRASFHRSGRGEGFPPQSYWLVATRSACLGVCGGIRFVTVPQMAASMKNGRIAFFSFRVGAQGE